MPVIASRAGNSAGEVSVPAHTLWSMFPRTAKIAATVLAAVAALTLSGCAATLPDTTSTTDATISETTADVASVSNTDSENAAAADDGECTKPATISRLGFRSAAPIDSGETEYASGEVTYAEDGKIASYTAAEGDTLMGIAERFCFDFHTVSVSIKDTTGYPLKPGDVVDFGKPRPTE